MKDIPAVVLDPTSGQLDLNLQLQPQPNFYFSNIDVILQMGYYFIKAILSMKYSIIIHNKLINH